MEKKPTVKENIAELRKILTSLSSKEDTYKPEVALEFLEAIENAVERMDAKIIDLRDDLTRIEEETFDLNSQISELEDEASWEETIEAGIGIVEYKEPENLLLQSVMENLNTAIKSKGALAVSEMLSV